MPTPADLWNYPIQRIQGEEEVAPARVVLRDSLTVGHRTRTRVDSLTTRVDRLEQAVQAVAEGRAMWRADTEGNREPVEVILRDMLVRVTRADATAAATLAAVRELARFEGVDFDQIEARITEAVDGALSGFEITLTTARKD